MLPRLPPTVVVVALASLVASAQDGPRDTHIGPHLATIHGLDTPAAVAIDPAGRVWIAEEGADRVRAFDRAGTEVASVGGRGGGAGELLAPAGIAVAEDGTLYVADTGNHRIQVFAADGEPLRSWGGLGSADGRFHTPRGIAVANGRVAVADEKNDRVQVFDLGGEHLLSVGRFGHAANELARPLDVAFGPEGELFVADADHHRIQVFDTEGEHGTSFGDWGFFPGLFSTPGGVAVQGGRVYVCDVENHRVQVFTPEGDLLYKWGIHAIRPREGKGKLHYPSHVAIAPDGDFAALAEPWDDRVQLFSRAEGAEPEEDPLRSGLGQPSPHYGFHMDSDEIWMTVVEPETHQVILFDLQWTEPRIISRLGGYGRTLGLLVRPTGLDFRASDHTLVVCDTGNRRLQLLRLAIDVEEDIKYDPEMARWIKAIDFERLGTSVGDVELEWAIEPGDVVRDSQDRIYVLDTRNERVHVFDASFTHLLTFGGHGTGDGQLRRPTTIRLSPGGDVVYVVDSHNRRVQAFSPEGESRGAFGEGLAEPWGLVATEDGLTVTDAGSHRVVQLDLTGSTVASWGSMGIRRGEYYRPRGVGFDAAGTLYVIDHANHRGLMVKPGGEYVMAFGSRLYTKPARLPGTYKEEDYVE